MKRIQFLLLIFVWPIFMYSQDDSRIISFFNDTLRGKWILQENCVAEAGQCDTIGRGYEYMIFSSLSKQGYVHFTTNGQSIPLYGDSVKLYFPRNTIAGTTWTMDDFLFIDYPDAKICVIPGVADNLVLLTINLIGFSKEYKRDKTYNAFLLNRINSYHIYPNPVKERFVLDGEIPITATKAQIDITTMDGRVLSSTPIGERGSIRRQFDMPPVKSGLYLLILRCDGLVNNCLKIVKQ